MLEIIRFSPNVFFSTEHTHEILTNCRLLKEIKVYPEVRRTKVFLYIKSVFSLMVS